MFTFTRKNIRLKDIDQIEILSERNKHAIYIHLQAKLKNGKTKPIGGFRLFNAEKLHPKEHVVSIGFPSDHDWSFTRPNELTINLGVVKATWTKKAKTSDSS